MSEVALETTEAASPIAAPVSRQAAIEAAWAHAEAEAVDNPESEFNEAPAKPAAITPAALDEKPAEKRASVAPSIREFIRSQRAPEAGPTTALETEISELRAALDSLRQVEPERPTTEALMLQKLEQMEERERSTLLADAEARTLEEQNQRFAALRDGALANINAKAEEYPGLVALGQQETVVNALFQQEEGEESSEDEVASEVEEGLREVYQKLHAVYGSAPSKAPTAASERPKTLTPALTGTDEEPDTSKMSRREKIDFLWSKNQ